MTEETILCGTLDEIKDYFSFVGTKNTYWSVFLPLDKQLESVVNSDKMPVGLVFYLSKRGGGIHFEKKWVFIREKETKL
jgi:hypothetical protein